MTEALKSVYEGITKMPEGKESSRNITPYSSFFVRALALKYHIAHLANW
jgi:hypothetical protein